MNNSALIITFSTFVCLLSGCGTSTRVTSFSPPTAEADHVVIYIYRPPLMSNAMHSPALYVNNLFKITITNGSLVRMSLNPGEHIFELAPDRKYSGSTSLPLYLNINTSHFIRVDTSLEIASGTNYRPYKRSFSLVKVEEEVAIKEINLCCLTDRPGRVLIENKSTDGFTIDKTQNPFSN